MGHGRLRSLVHGDGPHIVTVREGALSLIATIDNDGRDAEPKSPNQSKSDVRAVPKVRLATVTVEGHVLLRLLSIFNAGHRCDLYDRFTRGKTALGPRAVAAKFIILIGWIGSVLLWFMVSEETVITSVVEGTHARHDHILERD